MSISIVDHAVRDKTHNLYDVSFYTQNIHTLLTSSPSLVNSWIFQTLNLHSLPQPLIVGLDVEWRPNFKPKQQNKVATLQICVGSRCLVFQIIHSPNIPSKLTEFLRNRSYTFVGVGIKDDAKKLMNCYGLRVANFVDLGHLAADKLGEKDLKSTGLKNLAVRVLGKEIAKPKRITKSSWDNKRLTSEQVQYACIDAFVSFEVGRILYSGQV